MRTGGMLVLAAMIASPALAADRIGYEAIAAGDLSRAERALSAERAIFPRRPEVLLNLAAIYARTNRAAQARALYDDVLTAAPVALDVADGYTLSSHDVAQRGLSRLGQTLAVR